MWPRDPRRSPINNFRKHPRSFFMMNVFLSLFLLAFLCGCSKSESKENPLSSRYRTSETLSFREQELLNKRFEKTSKVNLDDLLLCLNGPVKKVGALLTVVHKDPVLGEELNNMSKKLLLTAFLCESECPCKDSCPIEKYGMRTLKEANENGEKLPQNVLGGYNIFSVIYEYHADYKKTVLNIWLRIRLYEQVRRDFLVHLTMWLLKPSFYDNIDLIFELPGLDPIMMTDLVVTLKDEYPNSVLIFGLIDLLSYEDLLNLIDKLGRETDNLRSQFFHQIASSRIVKMSKDAERRTRREEIISLGDVINFPLTIINLVLEY